MCISLKWVKVKKYAELTGDTELAVHSRRREAKWIDGVHCKVLEGRNLWVNLAAAEEWVEKWGTRSTSSSKKN